MSGARLVALIAGAAAMAAAMVAAVTVRPRPSSGRELAYLLIPVLGVAALVVAVWLAVP